jgi:hypothetical protein
MTLSEKGKYLRAALAKGQIIIDALKLASALLRKEPGLFLKKSSIKTEDDSSCNQRKSG